MRSQAIFHAILQLAMKKITWRHIGFFVLFAFIAFVIDRFAKEYLLRTLEGRHDVILDVFALTVQKNPGIAFSISLPYFAQLILTPVLLIFGMKVAIDNLQMDKILVLITLGFVTGGALSNYTDRLIYRGVIDYLAIWGYPVFNFADAFIVVGIFLLIAFYGKMKRV